MDPVEIGARFLFDLQGFLVLRGVLDEEECARLKGVVDDLEGRKYEDAWLGSLPEGVKGRPTLETNIAQQLRLNGLPRLDTAFDFLIDHPRIRPHLDEFVGLPQLINTWSISKMQGAQPGGWHRGVPTTDYAYRGDEIRSRMFNVVFFLTDNGPEDGCVVALPGSHKSNFDLDWRQYQGLDLPGAAAVTGKAGDVLMFSEAVIHNGLPKTTAGVRTNLYFNYVHAHYNVMAREPNNAHHFYFPPQIRDRFTPGQRGLTQWMEWARWGH
ncbi:MAG: hypothetical protein GKR89_17820 [Candidatus Latescibacteria bacterium]|nr:hypothetical protein [Candidatus Latescibacterota bacterium]